ncbi:MAG: CBS domain-containing protein [Aeromicrobium sp.]|uniref:CBS domain-containing protein n=1 Tax=Aeromicrobium sp. TaxID=1871063 RepID=UPI003C61CB06
MTSSEVLVAVGGEVAGAVRDQMISSPKTMPFDATIGRVREAFGNEHVHLVLLTDDTKLRGTLLREDLAGTPDHASALAVATLDGRTIGPSAAVEQARQVLAATDARRLAVVDDEGVLLGLLCLKRRRTGFCSEADLDSRRVTGGRRPRASEATPR